LPAVNVGKGRDQCLALPPSRCTLVSFWGSGKAGSTTMAMRLKHKPSSTEFYDDTSGWVDGGKEICWGLKPAMGKALDDFWKIHFPQCLDPTNPNSFSLDGCPRYVDATHAARLACGKPDLKFLWMVRDPIDRLVSEVNDPLSRKGITRNAKLTMQMVDNYITSATNIAHVQYDKMLDAFLASFPGKQMMIVISEFQNFVTVEEAQESINNITDWLGAPRRPAFLLQANKAGRAKGNYVKPSQAAINAARPLYHNMLENFFEKIGRRIPWHNFYNVSAL